MRKFVVFCAFLTCVSLTRLADGQVAQKSGELSGRIFNGQTPLYRAFVYIRDPVRKADSIAELDSKGAFHVSFPVGLYDVFVSEAGYVPACRRIEIATGHNSELEIELKVDSEHLESDRLPARNN